MEWVALAIGLAEMVAGGISGNINRSTQEEELRKELNQRQSDLQTRVDDLKDAYTLASKQRAQVAAAKDAEYQITINEATAARDSNLRSSSKAAGNEEQLQSAQIATLQVEAKQLEGASIQQVAMSGFRATGSALNTVSEARRTGNDAITKAVMQRNATRFSNYTTARNNFTNASNQIAMYQRQRQNAMDTYRMEQEAADLQYQQELGMYETEKERTDDALKYMDSDEYRSQQNWGYVLDWLSAGNAGVQGAEAVYNAGAQMFGD